MNHFIWDMTRWSPSIIWGDTTHEIIWVSSIHVLRGRHDSWTMGRHDSWTIGRHDSWTHMGQCNPCIARETWLMNYGETWLMDHGDHDSWTHMGQCNRHIVRKTWFMNYGETGLTNSYRSVQSIYSELDWWAITCETRLKVPQTHTSLVLQCVLQCVLQSALQCVWCSICWDSTQGAADTYDVYRMTHILCVSFLKWALWLLSNSGRDMTHEPLRVRL